MSYICTNVCDMKVEGNDEEVGNALKGERELARDTMGAENILCFLS